MRVNRLGALCESISPRSSPSGPPPHVTGMENVGALRTVPRNESPHELEERLQQAADWVNKEFDVRGLCMGLPDRLHALVSETNGDRLPK